MGLQPRHTRTFRSCCRLRTTTAMPIAPPRRAAAAAAAAATALQTMTLAAWQQAPAMAYQLLTTTVRTHTVRSSSYTHTPIEYALAHIHLYPCTSTQLYTCTHIHRHTHTHLAHTHVYIQAHPYVHRHRHGCRRTDTFPNTAAAADDRTATAADAADHGPARTETHGADLAPITAATGGPPRGRTCTIQLLRSCARWSSGISTEASIYAAYLEGTAT
jgi:hypothetical protein